MSTCFIPGTIILGLYDCYEKIPLALTYDDVLISPRYSRVVSRSAVALKTNITPKFSVDFPVVAINMQTIVNVVFAKAFSAAGGVALYPVQVPSN